MRLLILLVAIGLMIAATWGCSDKQKDAARLEQEMKDLEAAGDTSAQEGVAGEEGLPASETVGDAAAIPVEIEPEPAPMPPAPEGEGYTVQIASCEIEEYARHLIEVYAGRGYEPYVTTITYDGQTYYRVRIGNLETLSEARVLKDELIDRYSAEPWIDRLDQ